LANGRHLWLSRLSSLAFTILILMGSPILLAGDGKGEPLRRVILISCDTLSARHLPTYGYPEKTTATVDSLAAAGVCFQRCLAPQGWTLSSHITMLTGLMPGVHRVGKEKALPETIPLLAEILAEHGSANAAWLGTNQWLSPSYGFGRSFLNYSFQDLKEPIHNWGWSWLKNQLPQQESGIPDRPFFLFFHFMEPHSRPVGFDYLMPYWALKGIYHHYFRLPAVPPEPRLTRNGKQWDMAAYEAKDLRRGYDACIYYWDQERLRPLLDYLRELGLLANTLLIFTSDHGEEIAEHGGYFHDSPHAEVREVPLIFVWPGRLPAGTMVEEVVSLADLPPTVLDLAGLPAPDPCQGLSLVPLLENPQADFPCRDFLIDGLRRGHSLHKSALVAREADTWWSLVATTDTTGTGGTYQPARIGSVTGLFNLDLDPGERHDLRGERPRIVQVLSGRLEEALAADARLAASLGTGAGPVLQIPDRAKEGLRALGY